MRYNIRHLFLTLFIFATAFISKAQQPTTPLSLNDAVADVTDSLYLKGAEWGKAFNEAYKSGQYSLLTPHRERLGKFINEKMEYVLTMKDINNSKPLRLAMIEFLSYEKQLLTEGFLPFESLKPGVSQEEVKKWHTNLSTLSKKEQAMLAKVSEAQERYAAENGFTIEKD